MQEWAQKRIAVWGDSLGKGVIWNAARARYGYAEETAADVVRARLGCEILNRSKFGCTAPLGMELIERDLAAHMECDTALIEYGGNDCNFDWAGISDAPEAAHAPATPPEAFRQTLREIVTCLRDHGVRPVMTTLPPIHPERYFRFFIGDKLDAGSVLRWLGDVWQIYRFQEMYSLIICGVAREMQVELLDLRSRCLAMPDFIRRCLCEDGLHMNAEGQRRAGEWLAELASAENA